MYEKYWSLQRKPFENTPDPLFLYHSPKHEEALMRMFYAVKARKGAAILTGEYGTGKTTITRSLVETLRKESGFEVVLIANPTLNVNEFLTEILHQLQVQEIPKKKIELLRKLESILHTNLSNGRHTVIIIDEAQSIKRKETLEELRMLLNFQLNDQFLLTLILAGQPEIKEKLNQIKQFKQRLSIRYNLKLLDEQETKEYIEYRLRVAGRTGPIFSDRSLQLIHTYSKGAPRDINNICDLSLLLGSFKKKIEVDQEVTQEVIQDMIKEFE